VFGFARSEQSGGPEPAGEAKRLRGELASGSVDGLEGVILDVLTFQLVREADGGVGSGGRAIRTRRSR
jgi:hypothetical protein